MPADTYRESGVDIAAGEEFVKAIRPMADSTHRRGVVGSIGGFAGLFDLRAAGYRDPLLVAATDGTGTKLLLAQETGRLEGLGQDLVAMCVNDLVCHGAEPLFFLDYLATGRLEPKPAKELLAGIVHACQESDTALIGGETAEMPGLYTHGKFDLAGFAVGAVERDAVLPKPVWQGDVVLGFASSGVHANGFSLVRRIATNLGLSWQDPAPFQTDTELGEALLEPTRIYTRTAKALAHWDCIRSLAHITGGGMTGNAARGLPKNLALNIDLASWPLPPVFQWLGLGMKKEEMLAVFNCGIGMIAICPPEKASQARQLAQDCSEQVFQIGEVIPAESDRIRYTGEFRD